MKKSFLKAAFYLSLAATVSTVVVSCGLDDEEDTEIINNTIDPNNFNGKIAAGTTVTLDPSKTYKLNGKMVVENGASLIIPAGTKIVADKGSNYLIVDRGGKIFINGTEAKPVVFEGSVNEPGHWGGLVILGNAPTNRSASGTSTSELGDLVYGGTNKEDNSGIIKYVIIKNSGFKYNAEKEFNGLSLFGVGSGTTISHVSILDGADDGIEFFGGNVNADHLLILGVGDDYVDWTEGWQGTLDYVYAARKKEYFNAAEPGNRGIEADTNDKDPITNDGNGASNPTVKNITLIGNTKGQEPQGMKIRAGSNGKFDNIVIANYTTGIDFETDRTFDWFKGGNYLNNIRFVNVGTNWKVKATTANPNPDMSTTIKENTSATGAGNGTSLPAWAKTWSTVNTFDVADAGN